MSAATENPKPGAPQSGDPCADISRRAIQRDMALWIADLLNHHAIDLQRIGTRSVLLHFLLHRFYDDSDEPPKQKDLAERFKVSETRISNALSAMSDAIDRKLKG